MNIAVAAILVVFLLVLAGRAMAGRGQMIQGQVATVPAGTPPDLGQQLANAAGAAVAATGQELINAATAPVVEAISTTETAAVQAANQAVGQMASQAQATVTSAFNSGSIMPWLSFGAIVLLIGLTTHKTWSPEHGCCQTSGLGISTGCTNDDVIKCFYGYSLESFPREQIVNQVFQEMEFLRGVVLPASYVYDTTFQKAFSSGSGSSDQLAEIYTAGGAPVPNLPSLIYPEKFRIYLNGDEQALYVKRKNEIIAYNEAQGYFNQPLTVEVWGSTACQGAPWLNQNECIDGTWGPATVNLYPGRFDRWMF